MESKERGSEWNIGDQGIKKSLLYSRWVGLMHFSCRWEFLLVIKGEAGHTQYLQKGSSWLASVESRAQVEGVP